MDWNLHIDVKERLARVVVDGEFAKDDCVAQKTALVAHADWEPGTNILIDYRQATFANTTLDILRAVIAFHELIDEKIGNGKMVLLMNSPRDFGLARQYEMIADAKVESRIRVFLDENLATEWLQSNSDSF